jgi:hypothetical protein
MKKYLYEISWRWRRTPIDTAEDKDFYTELVAAESYFAVEDWGKKMAQLKTEASGNKIKIDFLGATCHTDVNTIKPGDDKYPYERRKAQIEIRE